MRFLRAFLLCLLCATSALPRSKPVVEYRGNFGLHVVDDYIRWHKYLEAEDKLLVMGFSNLQIIDLPNTKVVETRPVILPLESGRGWYDGDELGVSPDGRRMLIVWRPVAKDVPRKEAWVWDLREGKRLAVLDKSPYDIRTGVWSKNGKTIVTSDHQIGYILNGYDVKHAFSFWDGETYEYRGGVSLDNVTWWHLSDDGQRFFAATGKQKSWLGLKYTSDSAGVITVWDTRTGQVEKTISVASANFSPKTREIEVSPDGKFFVFVNKNKSNSAEHRLLAWEMNGSISPKYELKPQPKIDDSRVVFSPDGRYFAVDVGKNLQIYETQTGEKKYELRDVELPHTWLSNDVILDVHPKRIYHEKSEPMFGLDIISGSVLYRSKLTFREEERYNLIGEGTEKTLIYTSVVPHPAGKMFLTYDYEYVRIFDSRTGQLLQTVISPPPKFDKDGKIVYDKKGQPKLSRGAAVKSADWSRDGHTLYVFSANGQSVSVYGLVSN
ncbi:MAG TPA: WD40 repeat domain-containing protein [Pyrinomonadaceae bacterium]|jgi:DNA-binding beta-propeller fold protein YncE